MCKLFSSHQLLLQASRGFLVLRVSYNRYLTQIEFSQCQPGPEWLQVCTYMGWTFLLCHCQLCCETASLFLLLCHISLKALDRAKLGGESCTVLMTRWALYLVFYMRDVADSLLSTPASLRALFHQVFVCGMCAGTAPPGQRCLQDSLSHSQHPQLPLVAAFQARGWCGLLSSWCNMRKEALLCTTPTPNTHWLLPTAGLSSTFTWVQQPQCLALLEISVWLLLPNFKAVFSWPAHCGSIYSLSCWRLVWVAESQEMTASSRGSESQP